MQEKRDEGARERMKKKNDDDKHEYLFKIRRRLMSVNERAADAVSFDFFFLSHKFEVREKKNRYMSMWCTQVCFGKMEYIDFVNRNF